MKKYTKQHVVHEGNYIRRFTLREITKKDYKEAKKNERASIKKDKIIIPLRSKTAIGKSHGYLIYKKESKKRI